VAFYGTVASVKVRTGIGPEDLGLDTEGDLDTFIGGLLDEATDLMNKKMHRDWYADITAGLETAIPAGLNGIANDAVTESLRTMVSTRQTPVVRIDDFAIRVVQAKMLTPDILARLTLYSKGGGVVVIDVTPGDLAGIPTIGTWEQVIQE
jgi:hypothetical protein